MQVLETKNFKEAAIFTDKRTYVADPIMSSTIQLRWETFIFLMQSQTNGNFIVITPRGTKAHA